MSVRKLCCDKNKQTNDELARLLPRNTPEEMEELKRVSAMIVGANELNLIDCHRKFIFDCEVIKLWPHGGHVNKLDIEELAKAVEEYVINKPVDESKQIVVEEYRLFLFNDVILYAKPSKKNPKKWKYEGFFLPLHCKIYDIPNRPPIVLNAIEFRFDFRGVYSGPHPDSCRSYVVSARTLTEKTNLMKHLGQLLEFIQNNPQLQIYCRSDALKPSKWQGWLWKRGKNVKNWKRRFFKLKGNSLFYFPTMDGLPVGVIPLAGYYTVPVELQKFSKPYCFKLDSNSCCQRKYYLQADCREDLANWRHKLGKASVQHYGFDPLLLDPKEGTLAELLLYKSTIEEEKTKYEDFVSMRQLEDMEETETGTKTLNQLFQEIASLELIFAWVSNGRIGVPLSHRTRSNENKEIIECFFKGQAAVEWMRRHFDLSLADSLQLGNMLMDNGFIFHSVSKRAFENNSHFYFYPQSDKYLTDSMGSNPRQDFEAELRQLVKNAVSLVAVRQGFLLKKSGQDKRKEYFAMVYRNKLCLYGNHDVQDSKPKEVINLSEREARLSTQDVRNSEETAISESTIILKGLNNQEKLFTFLAVSPLDATQWVNAINNSLTFYVD